MNSIVHADIFFFVSTIALIVLTIGLVIIIIYVITILRNVSYVSKKVKAESDEIIKDMHELRGSIKNEGFKLRLINSFFKKVFSSRKSKG